MEQEFVPVLDPAGRELCRLRLACLGSGVTRPLLRIPASEAAQWGEEEVQLLESCEYDYEIDAPGFSLERLPNVVRPFSFSRDGIDAGIVSTGNRTGLLRIPVWKNESPAGAAKLEVRSRKIDYRSDYRSMVDDIANVCVDYLLKLTAPSEQKLLVDDTFDAQTLQQRFFLVRGLIGSREFEEAIAKILSSPHTRLEHFADDSPTTRPVRLTATSLREISYRSPRISLPTDHPLASRLPSIPRSLTVTTTRECVDTPENRFVKYALEDFRDLVSLIEVRLSSTGSQSDSAFATREARPLRVRLDEILSHELFREISRATYLPYSSPALQNKGGYREVFKAWSSAQLLARVAWSGGEDVFSGGKRDVSLLYEYWCLFLLWSVLEAIVGQRLKPLSDSLFDRTGDGYGLRPRIGNFFTTEGFHFTHNGQGLRAQFSYNRTFTEAGPAITNGTTVQYRSSFPYPGSWTRAMRPDFTFSFWPDSVSFEDAELKNQVVHVHFDAKYSAENVSEVFGQVTNDVSSLKTEERQGRYRRGDLLKMHAYRDAIRRSHGAYVLYPGRSAVSGAASYDVWSAFHELLPGLGAFSAVPGQGRTATVSILVNFLKDILGLITTPESGIRKMNSMLHELSPGAPR